jgi:hypothetical protein
MTETTLSTKKPTLLDDFKTIPMLFRVLAVLPFGLIAFGGAIGGALGAGSAFAIVNIAKRDWSTPIKLAATLGIYIASSTIYLVLAIIINLAVAGLR